MEILTIGGLAKATGTKVETIRWYEREGIMPAPRRTAGNYRAYATGHVQRLRFVRRCRDLGFSLDEVRELLLLVDQPNQDCGKVRRMAAENYAAVMQKISDLRELAKELRRLDASCEGGTVADCRILEAIVPSGNSAA